MPQRSIVRVIYITYNATDGEAGGVVGGRVGWFLNRGRRIYGSTIFILFFPRLGFPLGDVPFSRGEGNAHFGDGSAVGEVFLGVALGVDLGEGGSGGVVVFHLNDIDALRHEQCQFGSSLGTGLLGTDVCAEIGEQGVEKGEVVVLVAVVLLSLVGDGQSI